MNKWTIKYRLLFLAILPLTITVVILSAFFTASRLQQFTHDHERRGNAIVRQLAPASEYAVISGNQQILTSLAKSTLSEDDVIAVNIIDEQGESLIHMKKQDDAAYDLAQTETFSAPVYLSQLQISDLSSPDEGEQAPVTIGKVSITLSNASTAILQQHVLIENFSITGIVLLLTILFTLRTAKTLSRPLHNMSKAVALISKGDFSYAPEILAQGELGTLEQGIATMVRRLSEAKDNERLQREKLEDTNNDLKKQIAHRKRIENELREATDLANQANQAKSDFMGNMGHELRTPLNSIIGFSELLLMDDIAPKHREYAQCVHNSCNDLLHLIRDILDFSKLEAGKLSVFSIAFDLRQAIEEVVDSSALHCAEKDIELVVNYPLEQPHNLLGDPGRIRQIITNLVTNAIKFTENGQVVLRAHISEISNSLAQIHISVEDTGIGIAQNKLDSIFERFSQADTSSTRSYQGLGLGLTISKQLIELMGGSMQVSSTLGAGSVFSFDLRLPINSAIPSDILVLPHLRGKSVLIADDNSESATALCQSLRYFGMRVDTANNGASALAHMHSASAELAPYQLVFIDSEMPGMDIATLSTVIKQDNQLAKSRLVLLSPVNKIRKISKECHKNFSAILTKPMRLNDLTNTMQRIFSEFEKTSVVTSASEQSFLPRETDLENVESYNQRVLVVDDNAMNLKLAINVLSNLGYSVDTATDGLIAIDMVKKSFYDIILMDILMPNMNGYKATQHIREVQTELNQRSIIIALTAKALEGDREQCLAAGMDDYLSKPLQIQRLREMMEQYCS